MNTRFRNDLGVVAMAALSLAIGANARADAPAQAELKQVGATAVVYHGPVMEMAVSYRFAKFNEGAKWLMLDTAMMASGAPIEIPRSAVSVRTPSGEVVPLASQEAFGKAYPALAADVHRAAAMREPLGYLVPHRSRRLAYFVEPGRGLAFPTVWLDGRHNDVGRLYFQLPGGVQRGAYQLEVNLKEGRVAIPFSI